MPLFHERKIVKSLQLLSPSEFDSFKKWLQSPWCNSNKALVLLCKYIAPYYPDFRHSKLNEERLIKVVSLKKEISKKSFNNLFTKLDKQIQEFLTFQQLANDATLKDQLLARDLYQRKESDDSIELLKARHQVINKNESVKATTTFWTLAQLSDAIYFQSNKDQRYHVQSPYLHQADEYLDLYYLLLKFRYRQEFSQRKDILQEAIPKEEQIESLLQLAASVQHPAISIYAKLLNPNIDITLSHFLQIRQELEAQIDHLAMLEKQIFLFSMTNYAVKLIIKGSLPATQQLYDLYIWGLEKQILTHRGKITGATFINIVSAGTSLQQKDYVKKFVEEYRHYLPDQEYKEATTWAKGQIYYSLGKYDKCQELLKDVSFSNPVYNIQSRTTLLKNHFDLLCLDNSNRSLFHFYCKAFEKYLRRDDMYSEERKKACLKLVSNTRSLATSILEGKVVNEKKIQTLQKRIEEDNNAYGKLWLLQKINQLIKYKKQPLR